MSACKTPRPPASSPDLRSLTRRSSRVSEILRPYGNSLDTNFLGAKQTWGNRFELGFMEDNKGWFVSIMNLNPQQQSYFAGNANTPAGLTVVFNDPQHLLLGFVDQWRRLRLRLERQSVFGSRSVYQRAVCIWPAAIGQQHCELVDQWIADSHNFPGIVCRLY